MSNQAVREPTPADPPLGESEARYRTLADLSPDATLIAANQVFAYANQAAARLLGVASPNEIVGIDCFRFIAPDYHEIARERMRVTVQERRTSWLMESRWRRLDGATVEVEVSAAAVTWQGAPAIQIVVRDITGRKQIEREREASLARFTALVENIQDGVLIETEKREIFDVNAAFCRIFGIPAPPSALRGMDCSRAADQVCHLMRDPARFPARIEEILAARAAVASEEIQFADGRVYERDYVPIAMSGGGFVGHMWRYRDVTERQRSVMELRNARADAEAASQAKSRFLSTLSHELRTPLTAIIGVADLLTDEIWGGLTPQQREHLGRIKGSAWHLVSIIDEILTFTRAEAGKEEVRLAETDLSEIVVGVTELLDAEAKRRGLELVAAGVDTPVRLMTDGGKVRQILVNLVGNAVKYTQRGGVRVELRDAGEHLEIAVCDTGPGIPEDRLEDIFAPFVQLDDSHTRSRGGAGLGLAICRTLARLLRGEIRVKSSPHVGSTFELVLPKAAQGDRMPVAVSSEPGPDS